MASELSLQGSLSRAADRLGFGTRRRRSDRGHSRLPRVIDAKLGALLRGRERPSITEVHAALGRFCEERGLKAPSRATVYNAIDRAEAPSYSWDELPEEVRSLLHNVAPGRIPGPQVAFAAFNYGESRALSFAAGLPWLCLHHAARVPGFRPKSLALLEAVLARRGI